MNFSSLSKFSRISFVVLLFCCLYSFCHINAAPHAFFQCLSTRKFPKSIIYTTKTPNYTTIFQNYARNDRFKAYPKPVVILTPFRESHVSKIVHCAKRTKLQLRIRSGGHDYEGLSYTAKAPFAILDMFNLRSVDVDIKNETAWVHAGATLGELYYRIWEKTGVHGFPGGVCPTVGVGGHFSGGGYGNMIRKHGIAADNIVDARVVDAEGRILDRESMGEDLFWAIRGGGAASFCVVTAYKVNLVPVPPVVTVFDVFKRPWENATRIVHRWQFVAPKLDKEIFTRVGLVKWPDSGGKPTETAIFRGMYLGGRDKLVSIFESKFPELGLVKEQCFEMSWIESVLHWNLFTKGTPETALLDRRRYPSIHKIKSDYVTTPLPLAVIEGLYRRVAASGKLLAFTFNAYGGVMSEIPATATPFPHRAGNLYKVQYFISWNETGAAAEAEHINKARGHYDYMAPYVSRNPRRAFLNYRDIDVGSTDNGPNTYNESKVYGRKFFGENFDRLVRVKTAVDPTNFFRNEQSIAPLPQ